MNLHTTRITTLTFQLFFLGVLIALALGLNYLSAWTGPTASAPNGNVDAPLNMGTASQVKDGNLSVGRSTNTATDYGLISYGRLRSTIGGVEFPDGTVQATAAVAGGGAPTGSGFVAQNTTVTIAEPFKYVLFMGVYNSSDSGPGGGYVYPVGATWRAALYAAGANIGPLTLSATEQCASGVSYICLTRPAGGGLRVRTTNVSAHYLVF